jgi:cytochrome c-type biogenesis protein CcmH
MSLFVGIAVAMVAAALAWILVPLLRGTTGAGVTGEASNVAVLRDQMHELETDLRNGTISRENYELARQDLERRALEESKNPERTVASMPSRAGALTAALVAGALPIAAMLIYVALGNFEAFSGGATAGRHDVSPEQIAKMIKELEGRLEKDPGNAEGWSILARTYYQLNRFPEATRAYEHATALRPDDAQLLADYADALAAAQGGTLQGKPLELVTRALAADPTQWKALALAGTEAFDRKDYAQAVAYWERMKASVPPGSQIAQSIDASIAEARELGGLKATTAATAAATPAPPAMAKGPAAAAASTPAKAPVASASAGAVAGTVTLAPALAGSVSPNDVVFIFARPVQGPRMPLAIMKKQVRDLPIAFTLDDSMSMSPTTTLSSAGEVIVGARVSRSGQAIPQSGDVEGFSPPVKVGARGVAVVIEKAIP